MTRTYFYCSFRLAKDLIAGVDGGIVWVRDKSFGGGAVFQ